MFFIAASRLLWLLKVTRILYLVQEWCVKGVSPLSQSYSATCRGYRGWETVQRLRKNKLFECTLAKIVMVKSKVCVTFLKQDNLSCVSFWYLLDVALIAWFSPSDYDQNNMCNWFVHIVTRVPLAPLVFWSAWYSLSFSKRAWEKSIPGSTSSMSKTTHIFYESYTHYVVGQRAYAFITICNHSRWWEILYGSRSNVTGRMVTAQLTTINDHCTTSWRWEGYSSERQQSNRSSHSCSLNFCSILHTTTGNDNGLDSRYIGEWAQEALEPLTIVFINF